MSDLTLYTITYTYKTEVKFGHGSSPKVFSLANDFIASGDTDKTIARIASITCSHYHSSGSSRTWYTKCSLGGSYYSNTIGKHISKNGATAFVNTFSEENFPPASVFQDRTGNLEIWGCKTETGSYLTSNSIDGTAFTWCSTSSRPLTITVTFYDKGLTYYAPSIEQFEVKRVDSNGLDSDEGTTARVTLKLGLGKTCTSELLSAKIYVGSSNTATRDLTEDEIKSALSKAISIDLNGYNSGNTYYFTLKFAANEETVNSPQYMLPRAFAALHISGCSTGGVSIGGFSSSSANNPKFEVYHPAYLYGGLAQVGNGTTSPLVSLGIQAGQVAATSLTAQGYKTADVTFTTAFTSVPTITTALLTGDSSQTNYKSYTAGECAVFIGNVSTTGFKYLIINGRSATRKLGFNWTAVGMSTGSSSSESTGGGDTESGGDDSGGGSGTSTSAIATRDALGAVKVGQGLDISNTGVLSLAASWSDYSNNSNYNQSTMGQITFGTGTGTDDKLTLPIDLPSYRMLRTTDYGSSLPMGNLYAGRIFFLKKS